VEKQEGERQKEKKGGRSRIIKFPAGLIFTVWLTNTMILAMTETKCDCYQTSTSHDAQSSQWKPNHDSATPR
jgi:hypothetical protein